MRLVCWMLALTARAARGLARTSATTSATAPRPTNNVVFVGAGSFGSAMALVAARAQPDASIKIWARRDAVVDEINTKRRNGRYLPEDQDPFPSNVEATTDLRGAVADADVVVLAVPGEFLGTTLEQIDLDGKVAISLVKSARQTQGDVATVCEDVEAKFEACRACALSGPNIYGSLARGEFAEATVGALDADTAAEAAQVFASPAFRVDTVEDRAGVELCGVLKNVVALGSGFADAVAGPNARAALIRVLSESRVARVVSEGRDLLSERGFVVSDDLPRAASERGVVHVAPLCGLPLLLGLRAASGLSPLSTRRILLRTAVALPLAAPHQLPQS